MNVNRVDQFVAKLPERACFFLAFIALALWIIEDDLSEQIALFLGFWLLVVSGCCCELNRRVKRLENRAGAS